MPVCIQQMPGGGVWRGLGHRVTSQWHTFVYLQRAAVLFLACGGGGRVVCAWCSGPQQRGRGALH